MTTSVRRTPSGPRQNLGGTWWRSRVFWISAAPQRQIPQVELQIQSIMYAVFRVNRSHVPVNANPQQTFSRWMGACASAGLCRSLQSRPRNMLSRPTVLLRCAPLPGLLLARHLVLFRHHAAHPFISLAPYHLWRFSLHQFYMALRHPE